MRDSAYRAVKDAVIREIKRAYVVRMRSDAKQLVRTIRREVRRFLDNPYLRKSDDPLESEPGAIHIYDDPTAIDSVAVVYAQQTEQRSSIYSREAGAYVTQPITVWVPILIIGSNEEMVESYAKEHGLNGKPRRIKTRSIRDALVRVLKDLQRR